MHIIGYIIPAIFSTLVIGSVSGMPVITFECPPGQPMTSICPGDESAVCITNNCGECDAVWFGTDGKRAQCYGKSDCPPGRVGPQCPRNPCEEATCSTYPDAKCVPNYCGGCYAEWFKFSGEQVQCSTTSVLGTSVERIRCPSGKRIVNCFVDPCLVSKCPGDKNAKCVSNYCGGCNAVWYRANGRPAKCFRKSTCPHGRSKVRCKKDPCQGATCPEYPDAECVPNYCGGCYAEWFTCDGRKVQCRTTS
ncbi:unnamed protein product [Rotaria sp. Silwood1]|nr:unnamed protein product [Rotaria sp. Silwood1]